MSNARDDARTKVYGSPVRCGGTVGACLARLGSAARRASGLAGAAGHGARPVLLGLAALLALTLPLGAVPLDQLGLAGVRPASAQPPEATVRVRISAVRMLAGTEPGRHNDPDYYSVVTILDQRLASPRIDDQQRIFPNWELAHRAVLDHGPQVPVKVQLYDSDSWWEELSDEDDYVDICGTDCHDVDLVVDVETCQVTFGSRTLACGDAIVSRGDSGDDQAAIQLSVTVDPHFEPGAFGGPARLRVHCLHDPIWPDDGTNVQIDAEALDMQGNAVTADEIEIWEGDGDSPDAVCASASTCQHQVVTRGGTEMNYSCLARLSGREVTTGWRSVTVGDADRIRGLVTGDRDDRVDIVFHRNTWNFDGQRNATFLTAVHDMIDTYFRRDFILQNQDRFNFWIGKDAASITSSCGFWFPPERHFNYIFAEGAAVIHDDPNLRDCSMTHGFSAEAGNDNVFAHESGHMVFGLSDQYCCDSFYWQPSPHPNLYTAFYEFFGAITCDEDVGNLLAWDYRLGDLQVPGRTCRRFTAYSTDKHQSDPWDATNQVANSLMGDNSMIRAPAARRMEWVLSEEAPDPSPGLPFVAMVDGGLSTLAQVAEPRLQVAPGAGMPGTLVELYGTGFTPDESDPEGCVGEILWQNVPWDSFAVAADGTWLKRFRIPPGAVTGDQTILARTAPPCGGAEFGHQASVVVRVQPVDPARMTKAGDDSADERKLILAELSFGGADGSDISLAATQVITSVPPSDIAKPPLHRVELLDRNGQVFEQHNEWDPLLVRRWNEEGRDPHERITSGTGYYVLPFTTTLHSMRLTNIEDGSQKPIELGVIDLEPTIDDWCSQHPGDPDCVRADPLIFVDPKASTVARTEVMTVEVRLHNIRGLYGAQVEMSFDPTKVEVVDSDAVTPGVQAADGDVFRDALIAGQATVFRNVANNGQGTIEYTISLQGATAGMDAGGVLMAIELRGLAIGESPLHFTNVRLSDAMSQPVDHEAVDGLITVREIRNDEKKATVTGSVTLERRGGPAAPDNAGARVCIGTACVTTDADGGFSLVDVRPGTIEVQHPSYLGTEKAVAPTGEAVLPVPPVTLLGGDVDQDGLIHYEDGFRMNQSWNQEHDGPRWLQRLDVTNDGVIDIFDMVAVQYNYASEAPGPWPNTTNTIAAAGNDRAVEAGARAGAYADVSSAGDAPWPQAGGDLLRHLLGSFSVRAQAPRAVVRLDPADSVSQGLGLVVPVKIAIAGAADVFGYALYLEFDPEMLRVVDADPRPTAPGVQVRVGEYLDPTSISIVRNKVDNERGVIEVAVSATYPSSGSSGAGVLASADFRTIGAGTSRMHFEEVVLYKDAFPELERIPVTWQGGSVKVAGSRYVIYTPVIKAND